MQVNQKSIYSFVRNEAPQLERKQDKYITTDGTGGWQVQQKPLNPPSGWTRFKAWLSSKVGIPADMSEAQRRVAAHALKLNRPKEDLWVGLNWRHGTGPTSQVFRATNIDRGAHDTPLTLRQAAKAMNHLGFQRGNFAWISEKKIDAFLRGDPDKHQPGAFSDMPKAVQPFLNKVTKVFCRETYRYDTGPLDKEELNKAKTQVRQLYEELLGARGMTEGKLHEILAKLESRTRVGSPMRVGFNELPRLAREAVVESRLRDWLNMGDPNSMLMTLGEGVPDAVLKSIRGGLIETLCADTKDTFKMIGSDEHAGRIVDNLEPQLQRKLSDAIAQHKEAMALIAQSPLTPARKALVTDISKERRMDPVQVEHYQTIATSMHGALATLENALQQDDSILDPLATAPEVLRKTMDAFHDGFDAMRANASRLWDMAWFNGGDVQYDILDECAKLTIKGIEPEAAGSMLKVLTSDKARAFFQAAFELEEKTPDERLVIGEISELVGTLVNQLALHVGKSVDDARKDAQSVTMQ